MALLLLVPRGPGVTARHCIRHPDEMALDEMRELLDAARAEYDMVILDLGLLIAGRQSAVGSALADCTVLVAASGGLRQEISDSQELLDRLASSGYLLVLNRALPLDPMVSGSSAGSDPISNGGLERLKDFLKSETELKS